MGDKDISVQRFSELRRSMGYTQAQFAELLGIGPTTADIERGKTKLSGKVVMELLRQFNTNPLWLYGLSSEQAAQPKQVDVLPKVVTVDNADRENIVLVNAKAAAGYPQNIADTSWYE